MTGPVPMLSPSSFNVVVLFVIASEAVPFALMLLHSRTSLPVPPILTSTLDPSFTFRSTSGAPDSSGSSVMVLPLIVHFQLDGETAALQSAWESDPLNSMSTVLGFGGITGVGYTFACGSWIVPSCRAGLP